MAVHLNDAQRVDLLLPAILLRRVIAAVIREHEKDGHPPAEHRLMPALTLFDQEAGIILADLTRKRAEKLAARAWRAADVALEPMQGRPIATSMVAVTELLRLVIDDGTLLLDEDGQLARGYRIVAAETEAEDQQGAREVLATVERSARKAGRRMLDDLRAHGALMPPTESK